MGQETEDSQKLKRIAAAAYDYDNDPRWADYWSNILIPPHLSSRSDVLDHFKRKFYQRYIVLGFKWVLFVFGFGILFGSVVGSTGFLILGYAYKPNIKDPDLVVEVMSTNGSSQSTNPSASSSSSSPPSDGQPQIRNTGSTARASGPSATAGQNPTSVHLYRQTIQFSVNAWVEYSFPSLLDSPKAGSDCRSSSLSMISYLLLHPPSFCLFPPPRHCGHGPVSFAHRTKDFYPQVFVVAVLAIIPLAPKNLSSRAYRLSFMGTACSSLYSLYTLYGRPRAWNLQGIQVYFQSIIATKDFIYFIYCLTFVTSHLCLKVALIPILCRSLEHVAKFLRRNFSSSTLYRKYLEDPCVWVESNTTTLSILSSHTEIGLGFLLIVSLFSWQRNIIQTFMYWQLLKLMYHAPVTAGYHQSVWAQIGRTINPLVHRHCPFLNTPLSAVQRWWLR
ncbi:hypothetical protein POTOM_015583 [Populus tomentosa]|uniref:Transmembrane protein 33 n=1 Tax=Populus tomentosa TaxID=118781 RepID=A0A8X8D639_POPTO|nr:hypothetical protein POTOM_015583 [Populus tomentosa]